MNAPQKNTKIFQVVLCIHLRYKRFDVPITFNLKILNKALPTKHQENMIIEARKHNLSESMSDNFFAQPLLHTLSSKWWGKPDEEDLTHICSQPPRIGLGPPVDAKSIQLLFKQKTKQPIQESTAHCYKYNWKDISQTRLHQFVIS